MRGTKEDIKVGRRTGWSEERTKWGEQNLRNVRRVIRRHVHIHLILMSGYTLVLLGIKRRQSPQNECCIHTKNVCLSILVRAVFDNLNSEL